MTEFLTLVALVTFATTVTGLLIALALISPWPRTAATAPALEMRSTPQETTPWMAP